MDQRPPDQPDTDESWTPCPPCRRVGCGSCAWGLGEIGRNMTVFEHADPAPGGRLRARPRIRTAESQAGLGIFTRDVGNHLGFVGAKIYYLPEQQAAGAMATGRDRTGA